MFLLEHEPLELGVDEVDVQVFDGPAVVDEVEELLLALCVGAVLLLGRQGLMELRVALELVEVHRPQHAEFPVLSRVVGEPEVARLLHLVLVLLQVADVVELQRQLVAIDLGRMLRRAAPWRFLVLLEDFAEFPAVKLVADLRLLPPPLVLPKNVLELEVAASHGLEHLATSRLHPNC